MNNKIVMSIYDSWLEKYMFAGHGQSFIDAFKATCMMCGYTEHESIIMFMGFRDDQNGIK